MPTSTPTPIYSRKFNKALNIVLTCVLTGTVIYAFAADPQSAAELGTIRNTTKIYTAEEVDNTYTTFDYVDEKLQPVTVKTTGRWKDPDFWLPTAVAGNIASRSTYTERTSSANGVQGDTYWQYARSDAAEAYTLEAAVESKRREGFFGASDQVEGTWSLVTDTSGKCTLTGNVLKGGGEDATCVVRFTDTTGKSKELVLQIGKFAPYVSVIQRVYSEIDNSFRKAYSDQILQKFSTLDYTTGHVFPSTWRLGGLLGLREYPAYWGKEPWEAELFSDYQTWASTYTKTWNSSTNMSMFTGGVHDNRDGLTYKTSLISYANGPTKMNEDFFWPELRSKLCAVSGARADWYAEKTAIRISKHYLLCADHYHQFKHRFFDPTDGSYVNISASGKYFGRCLSDLADSSISTNGVFGGDWFIEWIPDGALPDTVPVMEFIGRHGDEEHLSLYNLSPSVLDGAPAIQLSQCNVINLAYINVTSWSTPLENGIFAPSPDYSYSHKLYFPTTHHWVNTSYPSLNASHPYYDKKCIRLKEGVSLVDGAKKTVSDIGSFYDATEDAKTFLPVGYHYPIAGDSSRPLMGFYNNHLWLYGIYYTPSGGDSCLRTTRTEALDKWIRQDSKTRYGVEEGLTFIDCCDLDPDHTYHTH